MLAACSRRVYTALAAVLTRVASSCYDGVRLQRDCSGCGVEAALLWLKRMVNSERARSVLMLAMVWS